MAGRKEVGMERDIVYTPVSVGSGFESVHVSVSVGTDRLDMRINSDRKIECGDLDGILESIVDTMLKKMRFDIYRDCDITIIEPDGEYGIAFTDGTCKKFKRQ